MSEIASTDDAKTTRPPRDDLFRAVRPGGCALRKADDGDGEAGDAEPVMFGHFAVFNEWTEIDSMFEGNFLERIAPGAFRKTFKEQRDEMRVLFQHGFDYLIGDKPLGPIRELREDDEGAYYEVPLLDAKYVREEILPGLEADLYGASFRFRVMREEFDQEPDESEHNPHALPERTIKEMQVREFGPVTFPAYAGASAKIRSLSDEFHAGRFMSDPERLRELFEFFLSRREPTERTQIVIDGNGTASVAVDSSGRDSGHEDAPDEGEGDPAPEEREEEEGKEESQSTTPERRSTSDEGSDNPTPLYGDGKERQTWRL